MFGALVRAQDVVLPGSTVQGDILPGQGQFLKGMAWYELNAARARELDVKTAREVDQWNREVYVGWLAAEPEAMPQTHRLRPWGFPAVSPSHPSVLPIMGYNESRWSSARSLRIPQEIPRRSDFQCDQLRELERPQEPPRPNRPHRPEVSGGCPPS